MNRGAPMGKVKSFFNSKIVKKDVGEPTYLTWKEALSYAMGRGAQGMSTSMTASKYVNFFITDVLHIKARHASNIRLYCGIFDAINDPIMGVIVDNVYRAYDNRCYSGSFGCFCRLVTIF